MLNFQLNIYEYIFYGRSLLELFGMLNYQYIVVQVSNILRLKLGSAVLLFFVGVSP